jgi:hypothetical protein
MLIHTITNAQQQILAVVMCTCAEEGELAAMAAAFASLPCKVLWRLSEQEIAVTDRLSLGSNTRVRPETSKTLNHLSATLGSALLI